MRFPRAILLAASALSAWSQPLSEYTIRRASGPIVLDAKLDEADWKSAPSAGDFHFNWFQSGEKEQTDARLLWDDDNLYVSWRCQDRHISAYEKQRHGPVSKDDCVEIFLAPNPAKVRNYYTFEINAIGTMLNRCRTDWWTGPPTWEPDSVRYRTTYFGLDKKDESPDDREWIVELAIPLKNFARDAANMPPRDGDRWRLNLNRIGGKTNRQLSSWSPIAPPLTGFHSPDAFGNVTFSSNAAAPAVRAEEPRRRGERGLARPSRFDPAEAVAGRELYNKSCTQCHGLDGVAGDRAPALGAQRRYLRSTDEDLYDAIKKGIAGTGMPGSPMNDADIRRVIAFIKSLRAVAIDMPVAGDVARGESLFFGKGGCSSCHMMRGRGGLIGPDLTNVGAERGVNAIKAAMTEPRGSIPRGFQPVTIVTRAGQRVDGVIKNQNNFSYQILGKDDRIHSVLASEVRTMTLAEKTLMPTDVDKRLASGEFQDLMAFLSRQARNRR